MTTLAEAHERVKSLKEELESLKKQYTYAAKRIRELEGHTWGGSGEIHSAIIELKQLERLENDKSARAVVWEKTPTWSRAYREFVVDKVTPKRIYIRARGEEKTEFYAKNGKKENSCEWDGIINVEATFPEGLDAFSKKS